MRIAMAILLCLSLKLQAADKSNAVLTPHAGDLVIASGEKLVPFASQQFLTAPYTVLYFGAGWCSDCRKFSPKLVASYNAQTSSQRGYEVLYISQDRTEAEMRQFIMKEGMRWPAVAYDKVAGAADLNRYHPNKSIPWLAVIDRSGTVLLHSESDKDAAEVLKQLEAKIESGKPAGGS
jgi:thiol-disulfide isomerase/thioredoxin